MQGVAGVVWLSDLGELALAGSDCRFVPGESEEECEGRASFWKSSRAAVERVSCWFVLLILTGFFR